MTIAENAIAEGRKKWGYVLFTICVLLALIMIATFVDIFIVTFSDIAIHFLNFSRCIVALGFSLALGKLDTAAGAGATAQTEPEPQSQSHPEPEPQNQPEPPAEQPTAQQSEPEQESPASEKEAGNQAERLEAAYTQLESEGARISGRSLATLAHVNRSAASKWLEARGEKPEPLSIITARATRERRSQ